MSDFALRPARPTDAGAVSTILSAFVDDTDWMPRVHTRAEDLSFCGRMIERGWVRVATSGSGIAGFLARRETEVLALYVSAAARGRGCGSRLLADAQSAAGSLSLWTFQANKGAQRFYERHGFVVAERSDGQANDEGLPDMRYEWARGD